MINKKSISKKINILIATLVLTIFMSANIQAVENFPLRKTQSMSSLDKKGSMNNTAAINIHNNISTNMYSIINRQDVFSNISLFSLNNNTSTCSLNNIDLDDLVGSNISSSVHRSYTI